MMMLLFYTYAHYTCTIVICIIHNVYYVDDYADEYMCVLVIHNDIESYLYPFACTPYGKGDEVHAF